MNDEILAAANDRLEWIRAEYGDDDIDFQTFAPVVFALEALSTKSTLTRVKQKLFPGTFQSRAAWLSQTLRRVTKS